MCAAFNFLVRYLLEEKGLKRDLNHASLMLKNKRILSFEMFYLPRLAKC